MSVTLEKPYCSLLDVQKETKNSGPELTDWYHTCINLASRWVEEHCRRDFRFHDHSEGEDPLVVRRTWVMEDTVYLPWPIITLTKLWVYNDRVVGKTNDDLWNPEDYYFENDDTKQIGKITAESRVMFRENPFTYRSPTIFGEYPFVRNMVIEGTFGYPNDVGEGEEPEVGDTRVPLNFPATLRKATAIIAATYSMERRLEQVNLEGNRIELIELNIPGDVYKLLNKFRNFSHML